MAEAGVSPRSIEHGKTKKTTVEQLRSVMPQIWELVLPRWKLLFAGLVLLIIKSLTGLVLPASTKFLFDNVIAQRQLNLLPPLIGAVIAATLIQAITSFTLTQLLSKEGQRVIAELRRKVQIHISRLPVSYYDSNKSGTLVARIMSDVEGVRNLIGTGQIELIGGLLTSALVLALMIRINYVMTGIALGALLLYTFFLKNVFKTIRPIFRERGKINAEVTGRLTESLGGVRVVKGYHAEEREQTVFSAGVERLLQNVIRSLTLMSVTSVSTLLLMGLVSAMVMYIGAHEILAGRMKTGELIFYNMLMFYLAAPVIQITSIGTQLTEAIAGLDRTREVLNERPEDQDPERTIELPRIQGQLSFEHVDFAYEPGKPVLHDVSFAAEPGSVTALVGSSGSGKSTIVGLVAAFSKPLQGRVLIDGVDLGHVRLDSYRRALGVVLQESFLFDGSIRENIAFSRPNATEEEILSACRIAHVDEFAERFKEKYDTIVGERGVKLSGGQRQRVSIARAVLANPRILILDEATSSLDSESEAYIQEGLKYLMKGRTTFVIAHRLSTIRRADQILVVEEGRIVERGTHESLYAQQGRYYDLYTRQHGLESNLFLAPGEGDKVEEEATARSGRGDALDPVRLIRGQGF